jgi:hypothetical protein
MKTLFLLLIVLLPAFTARAQDHKINKVSASPNPIEYKQPDGSTVTITLKGDENLHWAVTSDGYTLLADEKSCYGYAVMKKGSLIRSKYNAHNPDSRSKKEKRFLKKTPKDLRFSDEQIKNNKKE